MKTGTIHQRPVSNVRNRTGLHSYDFHAAAAGGWSILCGFDGTVVPFDVTRALLARFADPAWIGVERQWLKGAISTRQCKETQIAMLDVRPDVLDAFLDAIPLMEGFHAFAEHCRKSGMDMMIVSEGVDYAIRRVLENHYLKGIPVVANRLVSYDAFGYGLYCPHGSEGCSSSVCKCGVAHTDGRPLLLIGDGYSDLCLADAATYVMARRGRSLHAYCREKNLPHMAYSDFVDVLKVLAPNAVTPERFQSSKRMLLRAKLAMLRKARGKERLQ